MPPWPSRTDSAESGHNDQPAYSNVPTSPTTVDPLHPSRSPLPSGAGRGSYIPSPLGPGDSSASGSRSRPVSWGGANALDKLADTGRSTTQTTRSSVSEGSSIHNGREDRDAIKGILSGAVGGSLGPYSPLRSSMSQPPPPQIPNPRMSSSVASMISLTNDSKYPNMFLPNSNTQISGAFFPYSDSPHIDYATNSFTPDEDDALHEPDPRGYKSGIAPLNWRGLFNLVFVFIIIGSLVALFAGYPVAQYFESGEAWYGNGVGVNATGQAAYIPNVPVLIDADTPDSAKTHIGIDGADYVLVFSDEFNVDGRTFYEGDDPFWEAVNLNYWATGDYEWYDPSMITTVNGSLVITLDSIPNHNLFYRSGMLQGWNKFCFTGGYVEVSVLFPGNQDAQGFWPAAWTMGNLGRPGYGGATDGMWPYTYDSCDVGTLPNQTNPDGTPDAAQTSGKGDGILSYLPGQKASACTCPGEDHPGPSNNIGRNAPEIDIFEAEKSKTTGIGGQTSQSSQYAPFNAGYQYNVDDTTIYSPGRTFHNTFFGSRTQQSISSLTQMDPSWFQLSPEQNYTVYGMEYSPNPQNRQAAYINWVAGGEPSWGLTGAAIGPDEVTQIGQRMISEEPMALVFNLGISPNFQQVNPASLNFPATLQFDYVRVYQKKGHTNIGCDPSDHPTAQYINDHLPAYTNVNYTSWAQAGYSFPKNSLNGC